MSFIKNKITNSRPQPALKVICSDCETVLVNYRSMEAGMGPICLSRTRFIESIEDSQLSHFEGRKKTVLESNEFKTGILRKPNSEQLEYVTLLKKGDSSLLFIDRKKYSSNYKSGMSVTDSIIESLCQIDSDPQITISSVAEPKDEVLTQKFKGFVSQYKEDLLKREKDFFEFGFSTVSTKKNLTEKQKENRKEFIKNYKTKYSPEFKEKWESGEFSLATIISRLNSSKIPGARDLVSALKKRHPDIEPKDYGLTDDEVSLGLQQATLPLEKKIFSAIIKGESNLSELSQTFSELNDSPNESLYLRFHQIVG